MVGKRPLKYHPVFKSVLCLFEQILKLQQLNYFSLYFVRIGLHGIILVSMSTHLQRNSLFTLFAGLKQSLKLSSQILGA